MKDVLSLQSTNSTNISISFRTYCQSQWWLLLFSVHILISHSTNVTSNSRSLWLFPKAIPANYHRVELPSFVPFISFIPGPPQHAPKLKKEIFSFSGITISVPLGQRRVSWLWWCWAGCAWRRGSTSRQGRSLGESGHSNWRNFVSILIKWYILYF